MLTQAVVANAGLLRQVADWSGDAAPTVSDLARALDRDLENTPLRQELADAEEEAAA